MENSNSKIRFYINGEAIFVEPGAKVSGLLKETSGVDMPCGGRHACGKCMVYAEGNFPEPSETERKLLGEGKHRQGIRLACFLEAVPEGSIRALRERKEDDKTICLSGADGSEKPRSEEDGSAQRSGKGGSETAKCENGIRLPSPRRIYRHLGAAVDIGTTTIAASLHRDGLPAGVMGAWNPQSVLGADVISRIDASLEGQGEKLARLVKNAVSRLLESLCAQAGEEPEGIETVVITGNTAMLYFLTGKNPECLSHAPFEADELFGIWTSGKELGLCCRFADIYLPRCISAFVGADITTALLGTGICNAKGDSMMVDVGTNGEIVLFRKNRLICCATAAGPAFEGAGLSCGMRGTDGAVDHVKWADGKWKVHVIGEGNAAGICGSGVIDGVAGLLESGFLDETGYLKEEVCFAGNVGLSAQDIRQVQLAKSAVRAGMETLLLQAGIGAEELDRLYVAGGFGSYMSVESAERIGLFPKIDRQKIQICGNAALAGAERILHDSGCEKEAHELAAGAETVNLGGNPSFQDFYLEHMMFEV